MRKKRRFHKRVVAKAPSARINQKITAEMVRVIDEEGEFLGEMKTQDALAMAKERGYDLVEVSPKATPPVCKILEYGQFQYEKEKQAKKEKAKQKKVEIKSIRLSFRISEHDKENRFNQAIKFLEKGHKIKIETFLKGRERQHGLLAIEKINNFVTELQKNEDFNIIVEQHVKRMGGNISTIILNKQ